MEKNNIMEAYQRMVENEARVNGIDVGEIIEITEDKDGMSDIQFVSNLEKNAMLSETDFKKLESVFGLDWNHIRQVADLAEAKEIYKRQLKKEEDEGVKKHREKINGLVAQLRKEAENLK